MSNPIDNQIINTPQNQVIGSSNLTNQASANINPTTIINNQPINNVNQATLPSETDIAINAAISNFLNCMKFRGSFNKTSIENFKRKEVRYSKVIEELSGIIEEEDDWIMVFFNYVVESDKDLLKNAIKQVVDDFKKKGLIMPQFLKRILGQSSYYERLIEFFSPVKQKTPLLNRTSVNKVIEPLKDQSLKIKEETVIESKVDDNVNKKLDFKDESNTDVKENTRTRTESTGSMFSAKDEDEEDNTPFLKTMNSLAMSIRKNKSLRLNNLKKWSEDMTGWFESFERQTTDWSSSEKAEELVNWLEDKALKTWEMAEPNEKKNYSTIKKHLVSKLTPANRDFSLKSQFYSAKQTPSEDVDQFAHRLLIMQKEWPEKKKASFDSDVAKVFVKGLSPEVRKLVIGEEKLGFQKLWKKAKDIEKCEKETQREIETMEAITGKEVSKELKCYSCGNSGHISKECSKRSPLIPRIPKSNDACVLCGKVGHNVEKCFKLTKAQESLKKVRFPKDLKRYCAKCKMSNHSTEECRRQQQASDNIQQSTLSSSN